MTFLADQTPFLWDAYVLSKTTRLQSDGDFAVSFTAKPFQTYPLASPVTVCGNDPEHGYTCETTYPVTERHENVIVGLLKTLNPNDLVGSLLYGVHLRGDGLVEIFESGVSKGTFGSYVVGNAFSIELTGTSIAYKKGVTTLYTSLRPVGAGDWPLRTMATFYQPGSSVDFNAWPGAEFEARYSVSLEVGSGDNDTHMDVIQELLDIANASAFESNGQIKCWYAHAASVVASLDRSNFEPKGVETADMLETPNVVEVTYGSVDEDGENRFALWEDTENIDLWGEVREDVEFLGIPTNTQASRKATFIGRRAKSEDVKLNGIADESFHNLEPGDLIDVTIGTADSEWFSSKKFWVDEIIPENRDGDVELVLVSYGGDELFDDSAATSVESNDPILRPSPSSLPDPSSTPLNPNNFHAEIGILERRPQKTYYVDIDWFEPAQPSYMHDAYRVYRRETDADDWLLVGTVSGRARLFRDTTAEIEKKGYLYAVLSVTSLGVQGDLPEVLHIFVPSLAAEPPAAPENVSVTIKNDRSVVIAWDYPSEPVDFDGYLIKASSGVSYDPNTAFDVIVGKTLQRSIETRLFTTAGNYSVAIFALDTTGNVSVAATYSFTMQAVPAPTAFQATQTVNGATLAWTPPANDQGLFYEVREGSSWDTASVVSKNLRGTSIFVTISDTAQHRYLLASLDQFGNRSEVISLTTSVATPANLPFFSASAQGDRIFFHWGTVPGIDVEYEVRTGSDFDSGTFVFRSGGSSFDLLLPFPGNKIFWAKARSSVGLYSNTAAFASTTLAQLEIRNLLYEEDFYAAGWPGTKEGMEIASIASENVLRVVKSGGVNMAEGIYWEDIEIPARAFVRTYIDGEVGVRDDNPETWEQATYTWESEQAKRPWSALIDIDPRIVQNLIATDIPVADLPAELVEGWDLSNNTTGLRGTTPSTSVGVGYGNGRYISGLRSDNGDKLEYSIATPGSTWSFSFDICFPDASTSLGVREFLRFLAGGVQHRFRHNQTTGAWNWLRDGASQSIAPVDGVLDPTTVYNVMLVQGATDRWLFIQNKKTGAVISQTAAFATNGAISQILLNPLNNASVDNANAVLTNIEIWDKVFTQAEFEARFEGRFKQTGYNDFQEFSTGDYQYKKAIIGLRLIPDDTTQDFIIKRAKAISDVADVIDRGIASPLSAGWNTVFFDRNFAIAPYVTVTPISGAAAVTAEIRNVTATSFEVRLLLVSSGTATTGSVSWAAIGY